MGQATANTLAHVVSRVCLYAAVAAFVVGLTASMPSEPSTGHEAAATAPGHLAPADALRPSSDPTPVPRHGQWFQGPNLAPVIAYRLVCSLANEDAATASIQWLDAVGSVEVDGRAFWLFGDSFLFGNGGRGLYLTAPIAVSTDNDASDCISMTY